MRKNNENVLFVLYSIKFVSTQIIERKAKKFVGTRSGTEIQYLEVPKIRGVKIIPHSSSMFITKKAKTQKYIKNKYISDWPKFQIGRRQIHIC
jgi:Fe2+ transport system protein B